MVKENQMQCSPKANFQQDSKQGFSPDTNKIDLSCKIIRCNLASNDTPQQPNLFRCSHQPIQLTCRCICVSAHRSHAIHHHALSSPDG